MICKYCSVHGTSPQLAQADCCHTYTHMQSLRTHVHTPSVSHKTCPHPFSLSQNMSIPLQSLTKHVHTPSVSHNTRPLQCNSRSKIPLMVCSSSSLTFPCISVITWTMLLMLTLSLYGAPRSLAAAGAPRVVKAEWLLVAAGALRVVNTEWSLAAAGAPRVVKAEWSLAAAGALGVVNTEWSLVAAGAPRRSGRWRQQGHCEW